jgi:hypothetical protein
MAALQQAVLAKRPSDLGILEFGRQIWNEWSQKNLAIWKLSHGSQPFSDDERRQYLDSRLAVMHQDTGKDQGKKFADAPVGTLFYLCHGNSPQLIGQFTSEPVPCAKGDGWLQRSYRMLKPAIRMDRYVDNSKNWSPQGNTTFWRVGVNDLPEFERTLLEPYFGTSLAELADMAGDPIETALVNSSTDQESVEVPSSAETPINRIYYGPPGTGKTYEVAKLLKEKYEQPEGTSPKAGAVQRYRFVTFHQSYGYEEFIEGLRPVLDGKIESGEIQYEIRPGVFKELCRRARLAPDQRFAMVIDEINRGNISKVFGELITLIEADKREGAEHALSVVLPYSGDSFSVPGNIDIIGTMNTADRSLALLDTALRRRFDFIPILPDTRDELGAPLHGLRITLGDKAVEIPRMLGTINQRIEALYDRDHTIGHAYFTALYNLPDGEQRFSALQRIFRNRVIPLLEEYFFEDWQKIQLVLADNQKYDQACFVTASSDHEDDLSHLFGSDHGLDTFATKRRYTLQETAFSNPDAYIGIYQTIVR